MKKIGTANLITCLRILCSVLLLFTEPFSPCFWIIYAVCGLSDILDGLTARLTKTQTKLGALLDSIADIVFLAACLTLLLPVISIPLWLWIWAGAIFFVRITAYIIGYIRYRAFSSLHTYANKLTGALLFLFPAIYSLWNVSAAGIIAAAAATVSAAEELIITVKSGTLDRDHKSVFSK